MCFLAPVDFQAAELHHDIGLKVNCEDKYVNASAVTVFFF